MKNSVKFAVTLASTILLTIPGFQTAVEIDVEGTLEKPTIIVGGDGRGACINQLVVYEEHSGGPVYVWSISSGLQCIAVHRIVYGVNPEGFRINDGAKSLEVGRVYTVRLDGPGIQGIQRFVSDNGVVRVKQH